jgi:peptidyl-prolyl cis-trans isomerase A (cyclophilin A)
MKTALFLLMASSVMLAQTKSGAAPKGEAPKQPAAAAQKKAAAAAGDLLNPASLNAKAPEMFQARFVTTKGPFVVQVTRSWAPLGADRFYNLVKAGFFTDAAFFRVVPGFVVQFGLSARPSVSAVWEKARIKDDPVTQSNTRGRITFATAGPNTRTTQLFISFGNNARLDSLGFAAFGEVTEGMDVVDKIYSGYGEQPDQGAIQAQGKAYLDKSFPMLDKITAATIVTQ